MQHLNSVLTDFILQNNETKMLGIPKMFSIFFPKPRRSIYIYDCINDRNIKCFHLRVKLKSYSPKN